jgi:ABC-2 type transport system ATP-binding protein
MPPLAPVLSQPPDFQLRPADGPAEASITRLAVVGASHRFGTRVALANVNLELHEGEIFGLLGPNGAGKSTLMKAICGRLALDHGTITLDGADPRTDTHVRRKIGFVPQDIALYGYLTVRENLAVFAQLAGVARAEIADVIRRALEQTELTPRADQLCRTLSGGYQRRVNICASILHEPTLLVLDEPTVGIDIDAREAIHSLLLQLRARGTAILLTTHDLDQAQTLSDRIGIMQAGRFVREGTPADLLRAAFQGQTELITVLGNVDANRAGALRALGLTPTATPNTWMCLAPPAAIDLQAVSRRLVATGVTIKELRIRDPDLATLFVAALKTDPTA